MKRIELILGKFLMVQFENQGWIEGSLIHFSTTYNKLTMGIRGESWSGGSWEIVKAITTILLKMENACIFCNAMDTLWKK